MKISDLSTGSGVSIPTIKFYLREGLLRRGGLTAPNQAQYGESHLKRLDLIRVLRKQAGMSISDVGEVVRAIDDAEDERSDFAIIAADRLPLSHTIGDEIDIDSPAFQAAQDRLRAAAGRRGWAVREFSPAWVQTVRALAVIDTEWKSLTDDQLDLYMEALERIAGHEIQAASHFAADREAWVHFISLGTLLIEPLMLGLRRLAHCDRVMRV